LVPEVQATNLEAQWITQSGITEDRPFFDVGLTGKDQVVAVSDSGLDVDSCYFINDGGDVRKDGSVDMTQRKVVQYVPFADSSDYRGGHGTHVVGTVLGHRSDDGQSERDGAANGVAKDAKGETYVPVFAEMICITNIHPTAVSANVMETRVAYHLYYIYNCIFFFSNQ
jgi:subtilisin family serine protease